MLRWNKIIRARATTSSWPAERRVPPRDWRVQGYHATPDGLLIDDATWNKRKRRLAAVDRRRRFHCSLMTPVTEVGGFANWISPPKVGIDNKPGDFEY